MAYQSLFRQYRPQKFADVHGQQHVTQTLQNAIRQGRVAQAYLFCGPRGVGKTTVARILAKALNCVHGPTDEPCGECDNCRAIVAGSSLAVIEIDAASHRTIEDIRNLRADVQFAPTDGRQKIYILDEAHQITGPAFEAFLKTLEEPPAHAIFVLATTEPQKIPATILSRCQRFDFRRGAVDDIVDRLAEVAVAEGLTVERSALHAVARAGDGSFRDALSVLDQVVAFGGEVITAATVEQVLGNLDVDTRLALGEILAGGTVAEALDWLAALIDNGKDPSLIVDEAMAHLRLLLLARLECAGSELGALSEDVRERLEAQARQFAPARLGDLVERWAACDKDLRWHPQPRVLLELCLIEMLLAPSEPAPERRPARPAPATAPPARPEPAPAVEPRPAAAPAKVKPVPVPTAPEPVEAATPTEPAQPSGPLDQVMVAQIMPALKERMREGWPALGAHLTRATIETVSGDTVVLGFGGWTASLSVCQEPDRQQLIERALSDLLGRPVRFEAVLGNTGPVAEETVSVSLDEAVAMAKERFDGAREIDDQG